MHLTFLSLYTLLSGAAAAADVFNGRVTLLQARQGTATLGNVTCGTHVYSKDQVDDAVAEGCRLYAAGEQIGSSKYPHTFNNREGLVFSTSGPYQEFPILSNGQIYSGRAPGPDRVVFNPNLNGECIYVGSMTHTGARTTNGFVSCEEVYVDVDVPATPSSSSKPASSATATVSSPSSATSSAATATPTAARDGDDEESSALRKGPVVGGILAGIVAALFAF
ncbi:guanyl-specific ribonuclease-like protein [Thermochaetoides thermophila DSM 1495]|uniref:Guanyl-specific ribonuclease-like protein n=1 Tax=Chaetomium thermophilum (strain DSM 1495 / CBS 144.50 / IMI 039719) TaxID=759272 RepID=G0RXT8_CHATD|nr:guanyl-specific ribonuclease-like protein [Thermochaetoides thermophila DSM 1495]EGS24104.1 guanyl-specific ribonuclease-like protein [Thermochaetoides thermophila DSM 1495]